MSSTYEPVVNKDRLKSTDNKLIKLGHVSAAPHRMKATVFSINDLRPPPRLSCLS